MRKCFLVGIVMLAGCQGVVGPRERTRMKDPVDDPRYTITEQERRGRDRLAYPEHIPAAEPPRTALDPPADRYGR
jgi:hypothetical protein